MNEWIIRLIEQGGYWGVFFLMVIENVFPPIPSEVIMGLSGVAVARGTLHESLLREKLRSAQLLVLDTPFAREQEVQSGRADVFMTDYPYSQRFLANAEWARLIAPPGPYHVPPYAYAMLPGDDAWYARVERFVDEVRRDGRLLDSAKRHRLEAIVVP